jgi:hypothetical protein
MQQCINRWRGHHSSQGIFQPHVPKMINDQGRRVWSDKTMRRITAHLNTFAQWVHTLRSSLLGNPITKLKLPAVGMGFAIERTMTPWSGARCSMPPGAGEGRHGGHRQKPCQQVIAPDGNTGAGRCLVVRSARAG